MDDGLGHLGNFLAGPPMGWDTLVNFLADPSVGRNSNPYVVWHMTFKLCNPWDTLVAFSGGPPMGRDSNSSMLYGT